MKESYKRITMFYDNNMWIPRWNMQRKRSKFMKLYAEKKIKELDRYIYEALFDHEKVTTNAFFLTKTPKVFVGIM